MTNESSSSLEIVDDIKPCVVEGDAGSTSEGGALAAEEAKEVEYGSERGKKRLSEPSCSKSKDLVEEDDDVMVVTQDTVNKATKKMRENNFSSYEN